MTVGCNLSAFLGLLKFGNISVSPRHPPTASANVLVIAVAIFGNVPHGVSQGLLIHKSHYFGAYLLRQKEEDSLSSENYGLTSFIVVFLPTFVLLSCAYCRTILNLGQPILTALGVICEIARENELEVEGQCMTPLWHPFLQKHVPRRHIQDL